MCMNCTSDLPYYNYTEKKCVKCKNKYTFN